MSAPDGLDPLAEAVVAGSGPEELLARPVPDRYPAVHLLERDVARFDGDPDPDVRRTLRVGPVAMPELAPDEVLVAVMASSVNYNTVWSATFRPVPTFTFLRQLAAQGGWDGRHHQPFHVLGSDAAGVVVRAGTGVRRWRVGDHVVVSPIRVDAEEPATHDDAMLGAGQRAWGYETNFGGLAHYAVVRASQLVPKAAHLSWEEAASITACAGTAYRMLVSEHGARMKQGDVVLVWGAGGGVGVHAVQLVRSGGGIAVGVVSSPERAEALTRLGCDVVIDRTELGLGGGRDRDATVHPDIDPEQAGRRLGRAIRRQTGEDPHIVVDCIGRRTFPISLFVAARGGAVVTCGSSSGFDHHYDNRYLWMRLKRIIGSHGANLQELWESNRLVRLGRLMPVLGQVYPMADIATAARSVQLNEHVGKVGVLCLASERGTGVTDPGLRLALGMDRDALVGAGR